MNVIKLDPALAAALSSATAEHPRKMAAPPTSTGDPQSLKEALYYISLFGPVDDGTPLPCIRLPKRNSAATMDLRATWRPLVIDPTFFPKLSPANSRLGRIATPPVLKAVSLETPMVIGVALDIWIPPAPIVASVRTRVGVKGFEKALLNKGRREVSLALYPAAEERQKLWRENRLNLGALQAFAKVTGALDHVAAKKTDDWSARLRRAANNDNGGVADFYERKSLQAMRDLVLDRERQKSLPWYKNPIGEMEMAAGLRFSEPGEPEVVTVLFFEGVDPAPCDAIPLPARGGKTETMQRKVFRHLGEMREAERRLQTTSERLRKISRTSPEAARLHEAIAMGRQDLDDARDQMTKTYLAIIGEIAPRIEDTRAKKKELEATKLVVAEAAPEIKSLREGFTAVSKLIRPLAESLIHLPIDPIIKPCNFDSKDGTIEGRFVVTQSAPGTRGRRSGGNQPFSPAVPAVSRTVPLVVRKGSAPSDFPGVAEAVECIFSKKLSWLVLQTYIALSMDVGTTSEIQSVYYITAKELFQRIRPGSADQFGAHGFDGWWAWAYRSLEGLTSAQALEACLRFLSSVEISYETTIKGKPVTKHLLGFLSITSRTECPDGDIYGYAWNPELRDLITGGEDGRPNYTFINHKALFSYRGHVLHTAVALQIILEDMAQSAAGFDRNVDPDTGAVRIGETPYKDRMTLGALAEKAKIYDPKASNLRRRMEAALNAIEEAGPLHSWGIANDRLINWFDHIPDIAMSPDYRSVDAHAQHRRKERNLTRELRDRPFEAEPKRGKRGRPKKNAPA